MSGSPGGTVTAPSTHPADLLEVENHYLAQWGRREILRTTLIAAAGLLASLLLVKYSVVLWSVVAVPIIALGGLGVLFFRCPRRTIPQGPGVLLAPADGTVTEVGRVDEPDFIRGPALKVGIFLSIFDVHFNRTPVSGRVEYVKHQDGLHLDARDPRSGSENECQAIGIASHEDGLAQGTRVLVRQISGAIARRIICPLKEGQTVERGRIIGMIKYGSRTEVFLATPAGCPAVEVLVKVGDKVKAGETIIWRVGPEG